MYYSRYSNFPYHNDDIFAPVTENIKYNYCKYYPLRKNINKSKKYNKCIIL